MKLSYLYEDDGVSKIMQGMGLRYFKRMQDPTRSSFYGRSKYPTRSGSQDTPLKPRHRRYFNAPLGAIQGKIGYGTSLSGDMVSKGYFQGKGGVIDF
jgi:hypothetical protein